MAETMTDHTKSAGEVEARKVAAIAVCSQRIDNMCTGDENPADVDEWKLCGPDEEDRMLANAAIDAYLAKLTSTKPEPSRIAEIKAWNDQAFERGPNLDGPTLGDHHVKFLLSHITAIEADRDRLAKLWSDKRDDCDTATQEVERLQSDKDRLTKALEDVCNPLGKLTRDAEAVGGRLSNAAYGIANSLGFAQRIAREALFPTQHKPIRGMSA